ncbi:MAG TPA: SET domain-containing protein [Flavisolibacter sp.]|jgi:hypothetical protein|nr:SET domain-containing protein [Flavisolibacter sp.]
MALLEKHLFVDDSTIPGAGKGLFTKIDIEKGTRIVEYKGRRTVWKEVKNDSTNYYIYTINRNNVIDAQKTLSALARYANDAKGFVRVKGVNNNCVYVNDGNRAFIESVKDIPAGAEIFVDYTQDYWKVLKENLRAEQQREKDEAKKQAAREKKASAKKTNGAKATGKKSAAKKVAVSKKKVAKKKSSSK